MFDFQDYAWSHRPLVIFADSTDTPGLAEQRQEIAAHGPGLIEREMVVVEIIGDTVTVDGQPHEADPIELRERFGIGPEDGFVVLLIGKDTGAKLRRSRPVTMAEVFGLIDTMPMRRQEMADDSP